MPYVFIGEIPASGKSFLAEKYGFKTFSNSDDVEIALLQLLKK